MVLFLASAITLFSTPVSVSAQQRQVLHTQLSAPVGMQPIGRLRSAEPLKLTLTLRLRNDQELQSLLHDLYDPTSPNYRHFLTAQEFMERFGPTSEDYERVSAFAQSHGLTVTRTASNSLVLDVSGAVPDIERAFQVNMQVYQYPTEQRTFYAPDVEPSVELGVPVQGVSGLNNFSPLRLKIMNQLQGIQSDPCTSTVGTGSGPCGSFYGSDIKAAYMPGVTLDGNGQVVGIYGRPYDISDVLLYWVNTGHTTLDVQVIPVPVDIAAGTGVCSGCNDEETAADIEQVISMAPGLFKVVVYIGNDDDNGALPDHVNVFDRMASDNIAKQLSTSMFYTTPDPASVDPIFQRFNVQGQSLFVASGDQGAYPLPPASCGNFLSPCNYSWPADDPWVTAVGGTVLTTGPGGIWQSETAWTGSGGGVSTNGIPIPDYQVPVIAPQNQGSTTWRNVPDVAGEAANNFFCFEGGCYWASGTSFAAPQWAGIISLANQQANGHLIGFLNPTLYAIGQGMGYGNDFHDITEGNNFNSGNPDLFPAVTGYDLVTGWGTPNGQALLTAVSGVPPAPTPISPTNGASLPSGTTSVSLQWSAVGGAASYTVEVYTGSCGGNFFALNGTAATSFVLPGLSDGQTYYWQVQSVGSQQGFASLFSSCFSFSVGTTVTISGQVTLNGSGLAGVAVGVGGVEPTPGNYPGTTTTDASGNYSLTVGLECTCTVTASLANYTFSPPSVMFVDIYKNETANFAASPVIATDTISGQVTLNGSGLSGVTMTLGGSSGMIAITDGSGNYSFTVNAGGTYTVTPSLGAYTFNPPSAPFPSISANGTANFVATSPFTLLESFPSSAARPVEPLVQGRDGKFYGVTGDNWPAANGTVFNLTTAPGGGPTTLFSFNGINGADPLGGLVQGSDGYFYGTTDLGGTAGGPNGGYGTVYKISPTGAFVPLHSFTGTDGQNPSGTVVQGSDGYYYGTAFWGGAHGSNGTIYKMTAAGNLKVLYNFCSLANCADGAHPNGGLIQGSDGNFYGTTVWGGANSYGTFFRITPSGSLKTLYSFCQQAACADGGNPTAVLVSDAAGNFYTETTYGGGANNAGTVFKVTPTGALTTLHTFCSLANCADGNNSGSNTGQGHGPLVLGADGNLYGSTLAGGTNGGYGTLFQITPGGQLTTLHSFAGTDGASPDGLVQGTDGKFYGVTYGGGVNGSGVAFRFSVGLVPTIKSQSIIGNVGTPVTILGDGLTGSTAVTFNTTPAVFNVASDTEIDTAVPTGATSGPIQVMTPTTILTTNVAFQVLPELPVPNVVGETQSAATADIANAGLTLDTVTTATSTTVAAGSVISQNPPAGTDVKSGVGGGLGCFPWAAAS